MLGATAVPGVAYNKAAASSSSKPRNGHGNHPWASSSSGGRHHLCERREGSDESYMLLLELSCQEPTLQSCFKVIESTCLARGIGLKIHGRNASSEFQQFIDRYYLPFAECAIRHFFTLGFVPWRLRKISTGDSVPEVIPLGMFTWSIDSIPNRLSYNAYYNHYHSSSRSVAYSLEQDAAERAFQKQKQYLLSSRYKPYSIPSDNGSNSHKKEGEGEEDGDKMSSSGRNSNNNKGGILKKRSQMNTPAYYRQQQALKRQQHLLPSSRVHDDEETKLLRYQISFTESCGIMEDEVEIYEFVAPTNSVTRSSVLYGSVPSPLAHILVDYRNMRQAQLRQAHADAFNTQAKLICSYSTQKNMYALSEGNPILNTSGAGLGGGGDPWGPQQRLGLTMDTNLPTEIESNAYTR